MGGGRVSRGWALAKTSWAVLRADRSLMLFPIVGMAAGLAAGALLFAPGVALYSQDRSEPVLIGFGIVAAYALTFVALYFNTALAAAAARSLDGQDTSFATGMAAARERTGVIAQWAGLQLTVGLLLGLLQQLGGESGAGRLVAVLLSSVLNLAWQVATFFVIPVIALEGLGPKAAFKRSAHVIRERWGEGIVGSASIGGVLFLIVLVPLAVLVLAGVALVKSQPAAAAGAWAVAALLLGAAMLLGSTLTAVFRVALFRYATEGRAGGGFSEEALAQAFRPKGRRGRAA